MSEFPGKGKVAIVTFDPNAVREAGIRARMAVLNSPFSSQIGEILDQFFEMARARVRSSVGVIAEARSLMLNVSRRFAEEFQIATVEVPEFATERFLVEFDRLEQRCERDFKGPASLLMRRRSTLGALFFDDVAFFTAMLASPRMSGSEMNTPSREPSKPLTPARYWATTNANTFVPTKSGWVAPMVM